MGFNSGFKGLIFLQPFFLCTFKLWTEKAEFKTPLSTANICFNTCLLLSCVVLTFPHEPSFTFDSKIGIITPFFFFFFHWRYSPLWALACRAIPLHFSLSIANSLHLLTPSTWRSLSTSSLHYFLGLPLRLVPSISWLKIFFGHPILLRFLQVTQPTYPFPLYPFYYIFSPTQLF